MDRLRCLRGLAGLAAAACLMGGATTADAEEGYLAVGATPFQLALGPPGLQLFTKSTKVYGLRLSLLYGVQKKITGLDLGLFGDAYTLQGVQAGLGNQVLEKLEGVQLGLANSADSGKGVQIGLWNRTHHMKGLQIGLINWNDDGVLPVLPFVNWHF